MSRSVLRCAVVAMGLSFVAAAAFAAPEGSVQINYSRCDNNYEGWGLHTWKNPGIPLPGIEWANPMAPTGNNDFGIYWVTDLKEYGSSGTVNYIIHKGDTKEQGGRDMKFKGTEHAEIWVNSDDRKVYYSLNDAKAARAAKPCQ